MEPADVAGLVGDGTIDIHARVSRAVGVRLRTILDSLAQPRKLSAEDKGVKAPHDRLLGQAFARVVETYGTAALGFDGDQTTAAEAVISRGSIRRLDSGTRREHPP